MGDELRRSQRPRKSCGLPATHGFDGYVVGGQGRRWRGGWESSSSRKRARSPLPRRCRRRIPPRYYFEHDDREEDEQQSGSRDERDNAFSGGSDADDVAGGSAEDGSSGGSDADGVAGGAAEEQPAAEDEDSDDHRPLSSVPRARTLVHGGSTSTAPAPAPQESSPPPAPAPAPRPSSLSDHADEERQEEAPVPQQPHYVEGNFTAAIEDSDDDDRPMSRARTLVHRGSTTSTAAAPASPESSPPATAAPQESSPPAMAAPQESSSPVPSDDSSSVISNVTVQSSSALDCSICYLPLKSPIFQCTVGHVVCSPCHDKLGQATNCHVCRVPIPDGYSRCNAMEQVVESIRVPCPNVMYGCAERPAYHDRHNHAMTCVFKPCHCPVEGCGFAGPLQSTLLEHFTAMHGWPCSSGSTWPSFSVHLRKGFNVVRAGALTERHYTLVLKVEQESPVCNAITAFCIHPSHTGTVKFRLSHGRQWRREQDSGLLSKYLQLSELDVVCTDLSNGMPDPSSCFPPFLLPRWSAPGGSDDEDILVMLRYISGI